MGPRLRRLLLGARSLRVRPPRVGLLWTPGWWGWHSGVYAFNTGYWGSQIGYYGGINYGFGYNGSGYYGGEWRGNQFYYNRNVNNITRANITNVYDRPVGAAAAARTSFNGPGGVQVRPSQQQLAFARGPHVAATPEQRQQVQVARGETEPARQRQPRSAGHRGDSARRCADRAGRGSGRRRPRRPIGPRRGPPVADVRPAGPLRAAAIPGRRARRNRVRLRRGQTTPGLPCKPEPALKGTQARPVTETRPANPRPPAPRPEQNASRPPPSSQTARPAAAIGGDAATPAAAIGRGRSQHRPPNPMAEGQRPGGGGGGARPPAPHAQAPRPPPSAPHQGGERPN